MNKVMAQWLLVAQQLVGKELQHLAACTWVKD